jgi:hypothetical protein
MIQIILAVLILVGFCIGLFVYFGSSSHVNDTTTQPSSGKTTPATPTYTTTPNAVTGPTPAPGQ